MSTTTPAVERDRERAATVRDLAEAVSLTSVIANVDRIAIVKAMVRVADGIAPDAFGQGSG